MITLEKEFVKDDFPIVGKGKKRSIVVGAKYKKVDSEKVWLINNIQDIVNKQLNLKDYSSVIEYITIVMLLLPPYDGLGVNWQERKYFSRKEKHFYMDLKITDYNAFCNANQAQALDMLQYELLRGIDTYLSKVKGFDTKRFSNDVVKWLNCSIVLLLNC